MQADQVRGLAFLDVVSPGVANLVVQLIQADGLGVDRLSQTA